MLRWLGHEAVAVLDGDWRAWLAEGRLTAAEMRYGRRSPYPRAQPNLLATTEEIAGRLGHPGLALFGVRASSAIRARWGFIDPVAGHIPGAR